MKQIFEDVKLSLDNKILTIKVIEYPVVQQIIINGIKEKNSWRNQRTSNP